MFDFIKDNGLAVIALVVAGIALLSGGSAPVVGTDATTISNPWTFEETTGTTTVTIQSVGVGGCIALEQQDGSGYAYFIADATGSLATTTSSGC